MTKQEVQALIDELGYDAALGSLLADLTAAKEALVTALRASATAESKFNEAQNDISDFFDIAKTAEVLTATEINDREERYQCIVHDEGGDPQQVQFILSTTGVFRNVQVLNTTPVTLPGPVEE